MPDVTFGEWLPDRGRVSAPGLRRLINLLPVVDGVRPIPAGTPAQYDALPDTVRGAWRARTEQGSEFFVAGTSSGLYYVPATLTAWTNYGSGYTVLDAGRWEFEVYGEEIFATNRSDPIQKTTGGGAAVELSADASLAGDMAVFQEFLILGNIEGRGVNSGAIGTKEAGLHWSAVGNPNSWPQVGTQAARDVQSDWQPLEGDGGPITNVIAAEEYVAVFRQRQVYRMDYVGGQNIFAIRKRDDHRGCIIPGAAIALGNNVYFPSEEGFFLFDGFRLIPIGHEKVDRRWQELMNFDPAAIARVSVAHFPDWRAVVWAIPTTSAVPDVVLGYQYELGRWFALELGIDWLITTLSSGQSLDGTTYAAVNMDNSPGVLSDVDLDSLRGAFRETPGYFDPTHQLQRFANTETFLTGQVVVGDYEFEGTRRQRVRAVRPVLDGDMASVALRVSARLRPQDPDQWILAGDLTSTGKLPVRAKGRYIAAEFTTNGDVGIFQGYDPVVGTTRGGRR